MMKLPRTGLWYRFTPTDWQFIMNALAITDKSREGLAALCDDPEEVRSVLDHPKLFEAMCVHRSAAMLSRELFFFVTVRHTLKRIGLEEIGVADYMSVVCADFGVSRGRRGEVPPVDNEKFYHVDYMEELERARGAEKFFIHVRCANQFLVLTCLFPSFIQRRAARRGAPDVEFYERVVMDHLDAAGKHVLAEEFALHEVLVSLAAEFKPVRRAMNYTLKEYLSLG